jgi:hypothetical protein
MKLLVALVLLSSLSVAVQQSQSAAPAQPTIRYSFAWNQGFPWQKYTIDVASDGKAHFDGAPQADGSYDTDPYQQDFTMSAANRQKIFELAQRLNYFQGDFDSRLKHVAKTGTKTLEYESQQVKGSTSFDYSQHPEIQELVRLFSGIATTIDYGRKLAFQYRFDKLGLNQRMKELEQLQKDGNVEELQIIAPTLRKIADDPNMMNISRQSAQRLLRTFAQPASASATHASQ